MSNKKAFNPSTIVPAYPCTIFRTYRASGAGGAGKSILCQQDPYLLELVRYIHLNPLRARLVEDYNALCKYPYCAHSIIPGRRKKDFQDMEYILPLFNEKVATARQRYRDFVQKGIAQGRRPDLVGVGLLRSHGGWASIKALCRAGAYQKGDERILAESPFVEQVLSEASEQFERKYRLAAEGFSLEGAGARVAELLAMSPEEVLDSARDHRSVQARSLLCYWATRELGISQNQLAQTLHITQPAIS